MTKHQGRKYEMLVRVRNFGAAHRDEFPDGSEGAKAFAAVAAAVTDVEAHAVARLTMRREGSAAKQAAKRALAAQIAAIARSARVLAVSVPGADAKFPRPARNSDVAVLTSGRLFLQEIVAVQDAFVRCGLAATFVEDLRRAVATFEQAIDGRTAGKTGAAVSRVAIPAALKRGLAAVLSLDVLVRNVLGTDRKAMAAWKRVRHVEFPVHASSPAIAAAPAPGEDAREHPGASAQTLAQDAPSEPVRDVLKKAS